MRPPGTPVAETSAATSATRGRSRPVRSAPPARSASASTRATVSAELDDKPEPTGTVDVTTTLAPGTRASVIGKGVQRAGDEASPRRLHYAGVVSDRESVAIATSPGSSSDPTRYPTVGGRNSPTTSFTVDRHRENETVVVVGVVAHEVDAPRRGEHSNGVAGVGKIRSVHPPLLSTLPVVDSGGPPLEKSRWHPGRRRA